MIGGRNVVTSYLAAGNYVGEMGLLGRTRRNATVRAAVPTETVSLDGAALDVLLTRNPALRGAIEAIVAKRAAANARAEGSSDAGDLISFLMQQGLGEATDVLLIDEALCIGCDNCEKACAETHGGTSRLDRSAGPTFAQVHVPTSCRHCEDPHCMKDCPPDAIRRAPNGEVFIRDNCIGCGNCERNCPYGVIHMAAQPPEKPGLLAWLLLGLGPGPGEVEVPAGQNALRATFAISGYVEATSTTPTVFGSYADPRFSVALTAKLALTLASVVLVFFVGFMAKSVFFGL